MQKTINVYSKLKTLITCKDIHIISPFTDRLIGFVQENKLEFGYLRHDEQMPLQFYKYVHQTSNMMF